ncbi:MAG: choice-of-anchor I family protein [Methylocystis sp.]|uniref:choice-of-anchor I family protein n=1 Tax=Methylocystis sp. TaxID=1911079 RepID=UPI0039385279
MRLTNKLCAGAALRGLSIALASLYIGGASAEPTLSIETRRVWSYSHALSNVPGQKSEIVAYDERNDTLWVAGVVGVDVLERATGKWIRNISIAPYGGVNSVAIHDGLAALAVEASDRSQPGVVLFINTRTGQLVGDPLTVGALPDMVTFTPNGRMALVANEGTPNPRTTGQPCPVDPPGSVSLIDLWTRNVTTLPISPMLPGYAELRQFPAIGNGTTRPDMCPYDPEPEYIAVDPRGEKAYVGLQEANGVAVLDLRTRRFERVFGLGLKDFSLPGNGIDPNDQDGVIKLQQVPVKGLYQPDSIDAYEHRGRTYLVMANEGDARDNGSNDGEDERRGSAGNSSVEYVPDGSLLGRLVMSNVESSRDNLVAFGGRSFSIRETSGRIVFDSGNQLDAEAISRGVYDDGRSDNKGVEPEGVALMHVEGHVLAFIGLERTTKSAVAIYDVTSPFAVRFLDTIVSDGDIAPEGVTALRVRGRNYLAVANESSATTSLFEIRLHQGWVSR